MDVHFMIKAPIFSRQGFYIFQAHSVLKGTYYLLRVLAMPSFSVFYSAIEIGLYSLYRKKVICTFKLNLKKIVRSRCSFPRKNDALCCVYARARERVLMT